MRKKNLIKVDSLKFFLILTIVSFSFFLLRGFRAQADSITTSVTIGNNSPYFSSGPIEDPAVTSTSPANIGDLVTFKATGTDGNGEDYYLLVCSTDSGTAVNNNIPYCNGGSTYCTSTITASGSQATCTYTTQTSDSFSNTWYAFVCDTNSTAASCSAGDQGTGDSGSPFYVNHLPSFTGITNTSPANPGGSITWNATASDPDSNTVKLLVCKTNSITNGACTSEEWCSSTLSSSNPSCTYNIPSVTPDGSSDAYAFIVDQYNKPSTDATQGSNSYFTVNNVAPVVSAVTLNSNSAIVLTEATTTSVSVTATVTDSNSCYGTEIDSVKAYAYRSGITYSNCNTVPGNNNNCYPEVSCSVVAGSCTDITDSSADYTCSFNMQYHADPTDINTQFDAQNWLATVKATDDDSSGHSAESSSGVELNSLVAFSIGASISYGSLGVGQANDPLDRTLVTTATGNVGLDQEHSGASEMCTDYPTCLGATPIPVGYQRYGLSAVAYSSGTVLTVTPVEVELNVPKVTTSTPTTGTTWWGISIPAGIVAGTYNGANTITAVKGEIANW